MTAIFNSSTFLGLELATDQLRAALIDSNLAVLGYETVDFDTELQYGCVVLEGGTFFTSAHR